MRIGEWLGLADLLYWCWRGAARMDFPPGKADSPVMHARFIHIGLYLVIFSFIHNGLVTIKFFHSVLYLLFILCGP